MQMGPYTVTKYVAKEFILAFAVTCVCFLHCTVLKMEKYFSISKASFIKMTFSLNVSILVRNAISQGGYGGTILYNTL